jgi:hypothetical protein
MFESLEKIEKVLYTPCRFLSIKNVVTLGSSTKDGKRLNPLYKKTMKSNKYSDESELETLTLKTSDFLVFSYSRDKDFSEVYISYPHMDRLLKAFEDIQEILHDDNSFCNHIEGGLAVEVKASKFMSKVDNLSSGKSIALLLTVVEDVELGDMAGVMMLIGKEEYSLELNFEVFDSLVYFLKSLNLSMSSQLLINLAAMEELSCVISGKTSSQPLMQPKIKPIRKPTINKDEG